MVSEGTQVEGSVVAANDRGFQLQGEEKWYNWSKYAIEPRTLPAPGHAIRATLDGQGFVRKVELLPGSKRLAVEKASPETMQRVETSWDSNSRTAPTSGVLVTSKPTMQADREFRLKCLAFVVQHEGLFDIDNGSFYTIAQIAELVKEWAEGGAL